MKEKVTEGNPVWKCINPECRHEWMSRGWRPKSIRCPRCHKGYVLEKDIFDEAVTEDRNILNYCNKEAYETYLDALAIVTRKLFPMLPFSPFQVIFEEALNERQD